MSIKNYFPVIIQHKDRNDATALSRSALKADVFKCSRSKPD